MIINYNEFLKENLVFKYTEKDPEYWGITNYKWNNGKLDCYCDVNIHLGSKLPFEFGRIEGDGSKIKGNFKCTSNYITSLKGLPEIIEGDFTLNRYSFISTEYFPKEIYGIFFCDNTTILGDIENYPLCIIHKYISDNKYPTTSIVLETIKKNMDVFRALLEDKIKFHQMLMRLEPELIPYYTTIHPPTKKSILLDI